jgi:membrane-associated phospholipid phosphatase
MTDTPVTDSGADATSPLGRWERLSRYDQRALVGLGRLRRPPLTRLMLALTHAGDPKSWVLAVVTLAASGRKGRRQALRLAAATGLAAGITQALKRVINRPRPSTGVAGYDVLVENPDAFSFPSGHAAGAYAAATVLAGGGGLMSGALATYASGIALSRAYLGAHYPADVLAGAAIGAGSGLLVRWAANRLEGGSRGSSRSSR